MRRAYFPTDDFRSLAYLALPLAVRGFHASMQTFCAERETGGVIVGAAKFTPQQWYAVGGRGANRRVVDEIVRLGLARWEGDHLAVALYDVESERLYLSKRETGRSGGAASGEARRKKGERFSESIPSSAPAFASTTPGEESGAEAGRAREGKDEDGERPPLPPSPIDLVVAFQDAMLECYGVACEATGPERDRAGALWIRLTPQARARLPATVRSYVQDHFDASLAGFVEAYPDYVQRAA